MSTPRATLDRLTAALERLEPHLRSYSNVEHVDVGFRYVDGELTGRLAIRVFVRGPKIRGRRGGKGSRLLPAKLDGIPIDVIPAGFVPHGGGPGHVAARRPLAGGASIGTGLDPPGTLGCVVVVGGRPGPFGLTSSHVVRPDAEVFEVGRGGSPLRVGVVDAIDYLQGAAVVRLEGPCDAPGSRVGLAPIRDPMPEDRVREAVAHRLAVVKSGAGTRVTEGLLTGLSGDEVTISAAHLGEVVALGGDSGAIWTSRRGDAVGLHFGGGESGDYGRARSMWLVAAALDLGFAGHPALDGAA